MAWQKYRADESRTQSDGAIVWSANWMGGPSLAKIEKCRLENLAGNMRRTVYITGEADTMFSIPAVCSIGGKNVRGYVTSVVDHDSPKSDWRLTHTLVFRHTYF